MSANILKSSKVVPKWTVILALASEFAKGAVIILLLIYVAYYLKKGGFDTFSIEFSLGGGLLLLATLGAINVFIPTEVRAFKNVFQFESFILNQYEKKFIPLAYFDLQIAKSAISRDESIYFGYYFDAKFGYVLEDFKAALGDDGYVALAAKVIFLRKDESGIFLRMVVSALIGISLMLMYSKPIGMLLEIYL